MDEKKPHTLEVQLMRITGGNMNCINLVIPKILFILVLWDHPMENFLIIVTSWRRGEAGEAGCGGVLRMPFYVKIFWNCDTGLQKNIFCFLSNFEFRFSSPSTPVDQYFCS